MSTVLLVVLLFCVLFAVLHLANRIHRLENALVDLARIVKRPMRRDRAVRKEIEELEEELEEIGDLAVHAAASEEDFDRAQVIREKLDRRFHALLASHLPVLRKEGPSPSPSPSPM